MSNGTATASKSLPPESATAICDPRQFLLTCVSSYSPVQPSNIEELRMWLVQAFPANHSASEGRSLPPMTNETCGPPRGTFFAWHDPALPGLRMSQGCLLLDIASESSQTWPRSGSMRSGECFQQPDRERPICASASSSLPTIGASEFKGTSANRFVGSPHFRGAKMVEGLRTSQSDPAYIHPQFAEWAMGWPITWTELSPLETDKFQQWSHAHGMNYQER